MDETRRNEEPTELRRPADAMEDLEPDTETAESVHGGAVDAFLKIGTVSGGTIETMTSYKII